MQNRNKSSLSFHRHSLTDSLIPSLEQQELKISHSLLRWQGEAREMDTRSSLGGTRRRTCSIHGNILYFRICISSHNSMTIKDFFLVRLDKIEFEMLQYGGWVICPALLEYCCLPDFTRRIVNRESLGCVSN